MVETHENLFRKDATLPEASEPTSLSCTEAAEKEIEGETGTNVLGIGTGRRSGDGDGDGELTFVPRGGGGGGLLMLDFRSDEEEEERSCRAPANGASEAETARGRG